MTRRKAKNKKKGKGKGKGNKGGNNVIQTVKITPDMERVSHYGMMPQPIIYPPMNYNAPPPAINIQTAMPQPIPIQDVQLQENVPRKVAQSRPPPMPEEPQLELNTPRQMNEGPQFIMTNKDLQSQKAKLKSPKQYREPMPVMNNLSSINPITNYDQDIALTSELDEKKSATCEFCGTLCKNARGVAVHKGQKHKGQKN